MLKNLLRLGLIPVTVISLQACVGGGEGGEEGGGIGGGVERDIGGEGEGGIRGGEGEGGIRGGEGGEGGFEGEGD